MHRQIVDDSTRVDKKFYKPASFERWVVIVYENERRFNMQTAQGVVRGLLSACNAVGTSSVPCKVAFLDLYY